MNITHLQRLGFGSVLLALAEVPTIDLSSTEWPDFPHSEIMNAAIYAARGRVNSYPDRHATRVRTGPETATATVHITHAWASIANRKGELRERTGPDHRPCPEQGVRDPFCPSPP